MTPSDRPIKVLVAKPGLDGHDVGAKILCRHLMDAGMDVVYTGLRKSPAQICEAVQALQPQVLALSVLSGAHLTLCQRVVSELRQRRILDVLVLVGGNIPERDVEALRSVGVDRAFATGSQPDEIIEYLNNKVQS